MGLTKEEMVNINQLVEKAKNYISCGGSCLDYECREIFKTVEKNLSNATLFQKAQLPKINVYMLGSKIHYSFSPNFVDLKKFLEDDEFRNNELYVAVINEIFNYFVEVFNEVPLMINIKIDTEGNLLNVIVKNCKTEALPVVNYDGEEIMSFSSMSFNFGMGNLSIVKKDYYKSENDTNIKIPIPQKINSCFKLKNKVLQKNKR